MGIFDDFLAHCNPSKIPVVEKKMMLICGILDLFLWGIGTIVLGVVANDMWCLCIGLCQFCIPFIGWFWAFIWGIIILVKSINGK